MNFDRKRSVNSRCNGYLRSTISGMFFIEIIWASRSTKFTDHYSPWENQEWHREHPKGRLLRNLHYCTRAIIFILTRAIWTRARGISVAHTNKVIRFSCSVLNQVEISFSQLFMTMANITNIWQRKKWSLRRHFRRQESNKYFDLISTNIVC